MATDPDPPPNPYYERRYQTTVHSGYAHLTIPAPGGSVEPGDAEDLIEWLGFVIRRLEQDRNSGERIPPAAGAAGQPEREKP